MQPYSTVTTPYGQQPCNDLALAQAYSFVGPKQLVTTPITKQPISEGDQSLSPQTNYMTAPLGVPGCPPGLEYLTAVDQLLVKQQIELLEIFTGFETQNKYIIRNALGQEVYYAAEDSGCCVRCCFGPGRPFDLKIFDHFQNEVIHMYRPLVCCLQTIEVAAPPGNVIGTIEQEWKWCSIGFRVKNQLGETVLRIERSCLLCSMCNDLEFSVVSLDGDHVGKISKKWSGLTRELFTDADFFGINFPIDLDVRVKALLLGATFLIDAAFFERSKSILDSIN